MARVRLTDRPDSLIIAAIFVICFILRITTSARTVTSCDAGDFLSALVTTGNCHGPGYPLYLMSLKVFVSLFPFGSIPFRVSIYSSFFASVTCCLLYAILLRISKSRLSGIAASLAFSFSYTFWSQSVIPETYSLNAFFIALMLLLAFKWEELVTSKMRKSADNTLLLLAFIAGLSLSNHMTAAFAILAIAVFILDTNWQAAINVRNAPRIILFFLLGILPYVYLPAAAFRGPAYNFGDPSTPLRWFYHVTMHYQRSGLFKYPLVFLPSRLLRFLKSLLTEYPHFWLLGWVGLILSFKTIKRRHAAFLLLTFFFLAIPVMLYRQQEAIVRAHFYYPAYMIFAIWIGIGAEAVRSALKDATGGFQYVFQKLTAAFLTCVFFLAPLNSIITHYSKVDKSKDDYSVRLARGIFEETDKNAVVIIDNDNVYFPARYLQISERIRPDVRLILPAAVNAPGFEGKDLLLRQTPNDKRITGSKLVRIVEKNFRDTPVFYTYQGFVDHSWNYQWRGFSIKLSAKGAPPPKKISASEAFRKYPLPKKNISNLDSDAREAICFPLIMLATHYVGRGQFEKAVEVYERISEFFLKDHYVFSLYSCLTFSDVFEFYGLALNSLNRYHEVIERIPKARVFNPDFRTMQISFAYRMLNMSYEALQELNDFILLKEKNAYAYKERGSIYFTIGNMKKASNDLKKAIELDPGDHQTRFYYGITLLELGQEKRGIYQLKKVIKEAPKSKQAQFAREILERSSL